MFLPLDHAQYAPPLYLLVCKLLGELLGYREWVLRLPALGGGLLAVYGVWRATGYLLSGYWRLLPMALLFVNPTVLRYVTELKPYGLDLGVAALLIALYLHERQPVVNQTSGLWRWTAIGVLLPWLSLGSVFVLAAIGLDRLLRNARWLWVIAAWLISFGILYVTVLRPAVGSDYLDSFHRDYFFPLVSDGAELRRAAAILFGLLRLGFGFTVVSLLWGGILLCYTLLRFPWRRAWLLLPLLLVLAASVFHFYSLIDRLVLFVLPGVWLLTSLGAQHISGELPGVRTLVIAMTLLMLGGSNIVFSFFTPETFSDGRRLTAFTTDGLPYSVDHSAVPVVDYYRRIHPVTYITSVPTAASNELRPLMLYDVTTGESIRRTISQDSIRAGQRGCKVIREELYRAVVLRIKCPVRNSDP